MKEWFTKLRYKLAYLIAPDWIDDLEDRLSVLLCEVTGGRLSKAYYPLEIMVSYVRDYQQECCDECEYYIECQRNDAIEVKHGYWKDNTNGTFTCSECGGRASKMDWCGHCGTKMDGGKRK